HPQAQQHSSSPWARYDPSRELATGCYCVLVVSDHGRSRLLDDGSWRMGVLVALAHATVREPLAPSLLHCDGTSWVPCRAGRVDDHRGRTSTLHDLRPFANGRVGIPSR